jgi:S1-C subfamily serine protease
MIKDEVFALTFSTSDNSTLSDISGHISYMDESTIQTDIVFREPTMGATLINKKGKLIGVIQGKIGDTGKCFATPINIINEFIHSKFGESK